MDTNSQSYTNDSTIEVSWAMKAYDQAELHYNLITSVDPTYLQLSKEDDLIYRQFRKSFPDLDIAHLHEDDLKTAKSKEEWRMFCNKFDGVIQDFNYGTLLRLDPLMEYGESNTLFATRIQFLAIEIARNKEGFSTRLYQSTRKNKSDNSSNGSTIHGIIDATKQISVSS
ncbi:protein PBDC1 [Ciona intestinalis]